MVMFFLYPMNWQQAPMPVCNHSQPLDLLRFSRETVACMTSSTFPRNKISRLVFCPLLIDGKTILATIKLGNFISNKKSSPLLIWVFSFEPPAVWEYARSILFSRLRYFWRYADSNPLLNPIFWSINCCSSCVLLFSQFFNQFIYSWMRTIDQLVQTIMPWLHLILSPWITLLRQQCEEFSPLDYQGFHNAK